MTPMTPLEDPPGPPAPSCDTSNRAYAPPAPSPVSPQRTAASGPHIDPASQPASNALPKNTAQQPPTSQTSPARGIDSAKPGTESDDVEARRRQLDAANAAYDEEEEHLVQAGAE